MLSTNSIIQSMPLIFADAGRISNLGTRFRSSSPTASFGIVVLVLLGIVAGIFAIYYLTKFIEKRAAKAQHNPWRLFKRLCKAHALGFRQRWLLKQLVTSANLQYPASVFVTPEVFDLIDRDPELVGNKRQFDDIFDRLFATDDDLD